ncbi:MAG: hypothetical protein R2932_49920 [Caldilineaceae bacterium]
MSRRFRVHGHSSRKVRAAKRLLAESQQLYQALGNNQATSTPIFFRAALAYIEKAYVEAEALYRQAYAYAEASGSQHLICEFQIYLALTSLRLGNGNQAFKLVANALAYFGNSTSIDNLTLSLAVFSLIALAAKHTACGLRVAARALQMQRYGRVQLLCSTIMHELAEAITIVHAQMNDGGIATFQSEGETMPLNELVAIALGLATKISSVGNQ